MSQPQATRPHFPKGYLENPKSMVPWSYVEQRLTEAINYWVCSVRPNNKPHVIPVWAAWVDGCVYFDGSPETRHARNIARNPSVAVHLESGDDVLIVEGTAQMLQTVDPELGRKVAPAFSAKYASEGYSPQPNQWDKGGLFQVRPQMVLAWTKFTDDPTKFVLEPE
jgi:nitroimidazol reductase NimA-like FMN-containing flavoprotein (pyridoxamine 5'-phosphate oxidase superfamily)